MTGSWVEAHGTGTHTTTQGTLHFVTMKSKSGAYLAAIEGTGMEPVVVSDTDEPSVARVIIAMKDALGVPLNVCM